MHRLELCWNPEPVCPYCGHKRGDAWEINFGLGLEGSTEIDCGNCEKPYFVERNIEVTYSTSPLPQPPAAGEEEE